MSKWRNVYICHSLGLKKVHRTWAAFLNKLCKEETILVRKNEF